MKRFFALLLIIVVLLAGCRKAAESYTYEHDGKTLLVNTVAQTITVGDDVYRYLLHEGAGNVTMNITYPNGTVMTVTQNKSGIGTSSGGLTVEEANRYVSEWTLLDAVQDHSTEARRFHFGYFLLSLFCIGVGLFYVLDTETAIHLRHMWWFRNAEPTEFALASTKFSGILFTIMGIVILFLSFFQS